MIQFPLLRNDLRSAVCEVSQSGGSLFNILRFVCRGRRTVRNSGLCAERNGHKFIRIGGESESRFGGFLGDEGGGDCCCFKIKGGVFGEELSSRQSGIRNENLVRRKRRKEFWGYN